VRGDEPRPARSQLLPFVRDPEVNRAAEDDAELLVRVAVLGDDRAGIELDDAQRQLLAVERPRGDSVPDPLRRDLGKVTERAHAASIAPLLSRNVETGSWAIVVPGHSFAGRVSARCRRVLTRAAALAELREPRVVVFSGWAARGRASEAEQMLEAWPGRRDVELLVEPTARITAQNASRTLPLLRERDVREATIVCSTLHAPRARYLFREVYERFGIRCDVVGAWTPPTPFALAWELGAVAVLRRQRRAAVAELEAAYRG
jgi:hypothetical protein